MNYRKNVVHPISGVTHIMNTNSMYNIMTGVSSNSVHDLVSLMTQIRNAKEAVSQCSIENFKHRRNVLLNLQETLELKLINTDDMLIQQGYFCFIYFV